MILWKMFDTQKGPALKRLQVLWLLSDSPEFLTSLTKACRVIKEQRDDHWVNTFTHDAMEEICRLGHMPLFMEALGGTLRDKAIISRTTSAETM